MKKEGKRNFVHIILLIVLWISSLLFFGLVLGTIGHEFIGHGLTAVAFGNHLIGIKVLIFQLDSNGFSIVPFDGFGSIWWDDLISPSVHSWIFISIMAGIVPLIVSIIFSFLLLLKEQKGFKKILFICFSIWFIDALCNYFIWPYLSGGGGDFKDLINHTGVNLLPFTIISIISAVIISSIILYKLIGRNSQKIKGILFYSLIGLSLALVIYIIYLIAFGNAVAEGGFDYCQKIGNIERIDGCSFSIALTTENSSICNILSKDSAKNECFKYIALFYSDPSLCKEILIPEDKEDCYYHFASEDKNPSLCNMIDNKTISEECLQEFENTF